MSDKVPLRAYADKTSASVSHSQGPCMNPARHRTPKVVAASLLAATLLFNPWTGLLHQLGTRINGPTFDESSIDWDLNTHLSLDEPRHDGDWSCSDLSFEGGANSTSLAFNLTTSAEVIKLWNRGPLVGNFTAQSGETAGSNIEVDLTFEKPEWYDEDDTTRSKVKICSLQNHDGEVYGVGIFVPSCGHHEEEVVTEPPIPPKWPTPSGRAVRANVGVRFPAAENGRLKLKRFSTGLPGLVHDVGDLDVTFERLDLVGASIQATGVSATSIGSVSVLGGIKGNFSASRELNLVAPSGPIEAKVSLYNDWENERPAPPTKFNAVSKGYLNANVSLLTYSSDQSTFPPSYWVQTHSSHSPTNLTFLAQPLLSNLKVETTSTDSPSFVALAPEFEGTFELVAVKNEPAVSVNKKRKDPSGEGRQRVVEISRQRWLPWILHGSAYWKKGDTSTVLLSDKPAVKVTTVNAPLTLHLS